VQFVIDGTQAELLVEEESLGRWSLYDVRARRLVASAFEIELDGDEVTFVADDPVEFAYRGVEHMAETWATLKSKRVAGRTIAVRKSRKGTIASRIEDMREAMLANLEDDGAPRHLAGEVAVPDSATAAPSVEGPAEPTSSHQTPDTHDPLREELQWIEEEKRRLAEERARLEEERRLAERREEDRVEAFRLEMQRLRAEREDLRRGVAEPYEDGEPFEADESPEPVVDETVDEVVEAPVEVPVEPEVEAEVDERPDEPVDEVVDEPVEVPVERVVGPEVEAVVDERPDEPVDEAVEEPVSGVVDLNDLEEGEEPMSPREPVGAGSSTVPRPPSAGASSARERGGLMGAVRAAFRSGSRDHSHQFIEAPGGIGITRYVCEECGYVSISA